MSSSLSSPTIAVCSVCRVSASSTDDAVIKKLLKCGRCRTKLYCSRACQKADWARHKLACRPAFALHELEDPANKAAAAARNRASPYGYPYHAGNPMPYHQTYCQVFGEDLNELVIDRQCQSTPFSTIWAEGVGDYYVSTDRAALFIAESMPGAFLQTVDAPAPLIPWICRRGSTFRPASMVRLLVGSGTDTTATRYQAM